MVWVALEAAISCRKKAVGEWWICAPWSAGRETVCQSVRKTNKVLLLHEDTRTGAWRRAAASITESVWKI